eukprot:c20976_g1_i2 orf=162-1913(+)
MDKTKTYDKHAEADGRAGQPGDLNWWQREMLRKHVAAGGGLDSDLPYLPSMPWSYPPPLFAHPLYQQFAHAGMPLSPVQTQEPETSQESEQGGTQPHSSNKAQLSQDPEMSGPSVGTGRYSFHSASADSNHEDFHNMGGTRAPYGYPGGFAFPTPPYPGQLDPLMLWMHHMQRQAAYLYSIPGCRNGYQRPIPVPSAGGNQRGFIKIPSGIPQKQSRLWETQSTENMQLWATITQLCATVTRAEAEIFCQRGKIMKLEDELQIMKTRQDAMSEALKGTTQARRRKRTATAPVAILGLPASQPLPARAQGKKARGSMGESDPLKVRNEHASEVKPEQTALGNTLECTNGSTQDGNGNLTSLTVGLNRSESGTDVLDKDRVERQHASTDNLCVDIVSIADSRQESQILIRDIVPAETAKETSGLQNVEIKQECIADFLPNETGRLKEGAVSGDCVIDMEIMKRSEVCITENGAQREAGSADCSMKSELTGLIKKDDWSEGMVIDPAHVSRQGGMLYDNTRLERLNAINSQNVVAIVHSATIENGELVASEQCNEEAENMNGATLDSFNGGIGLNPETSVSKDPQI